MNILRFLSGQLTVGRMLVRSSAGAEACRRERPPVARATTRTRRPRPGADRRRG